MHNEQAVLAAIRQEAEKLPGHVGFYYKNLVTGLEYGIREEEAFLAASVIKFPIFLYVLAQIAAGAFSPDQKLRVEEADKVPGCGAMSLFTGPVEADIRTLCRLMIDLSDNTATNRLIRHCGMEPLNRFFRSQGLEKTVLRRLLFDAEASARGLENTVCPRELGTLLEALYRGSFVSPETSRYALEVLLDQQVCHKLDGKLCGEVPIAHKTGEDEQLSNDVGIVFAGEPFVICFAGHDTDVYAWEDLMRRSTWALVREQGSTEGGRL